MSCRSHSPPLPVVRPGRVTRATGNGFPPGAAVVLTWQQAFGRATVTAGSDGSFVSDLVVFPSAPLGPRPLVVDVEGIGPVPDPPTLLVVPPPGQPPDFATRG